MLPIGDDETAGELHDRMKEVGAALLVKTLAGLADGSLKERPQSEIKSLQVELTSTTLATNLSEVEETNSPLTAQRSPLQHASKIFTDTCKIDWTRSTGEVYNLVRGLSPYPAAFTTLGGRVLKIYRCEKGEKRELLLPGNFETDKKTYLRFGCADGVIHVKELQLEGKKRMEVGEFLRGYRFE
jgi:methionyl-tRNA formyltransferase